MNDATKHKIVCPKREIMFKSQKMHQDWEYFGCYWISSLVWWQLFRQHRARDTSPIAGIHLRRNAQIAMASQDYNNTVFSLYVEHNSDNQVVCQLERERYLERGTTDIGRSTAGGQYMLRAQNITCKIYCTGYCTEYFLHRILLAQNIKGALERNFRRNLGFCPNLNTYIEYQLYRIFH